MLRARNPCAICGRNSEAIADDEKGIEASTCVVGFQPDNEIDVARGAHVTMSIHCEAADNQILNAGLIESPDDGFDAANFHAAVAEWGDKCEGRLE